MKETTPPALASRAQAPGPSWLNLRSSWPGRVIFVTLLALLGAWLWLLPGDVLHHLDLIGYAICHRLPERSFVVGGRTLPLCARCSGIYIGVMSNLAVMTLLRRWRSAALPSPMLLAALLAFFVAMGVDGVNSYLTFFPGLPHLYEPHNVLRLLTGMLHGITLSSLIFPVFNQTMWSDADPQPALRSFWELALIIAVAGLVASSFIAPIPILLYPLALVSSGGVLVMLTMINSVIVVTLLRHENRFSAWRPAQGPLAVGLALALAQVSALDLFRAVITQAFNLPF